jgi:hypothetical protein
MLTAYKKEWILRISVFDRLGKPTGQSHQAYRKKSVFQRLSFNDVNTNTKVSVTLIPRHSVF